MRMKLKMFVVVVVADAVVWCWDNFDYLFIICFQKNRKNILFRKFKTGRKMVLVIMD